MVIDTTIRVWPAIWTIALFIIQGAFFVVIKFNDVAHLHKEVQRLDSDVKEQNKVQTEIKERLANIEGKLDFLVAHSKAKRK